MEERFLTSRRRSPVDGSRLLIVRERDVGLFSMVWQVLNTLHLLEEQAIDRVPVAVWGRGSVYFHPEGHHGRRTVWEYYFEPLVDGVPEDLVLDALGPRAFDLLEAKRRQLEHERGAIELPHDPRLLGPLTDGDRSDIAEIEERLSGSDWAWTESYVPTVDGRRAGQSLSTERAADLLHRYVRPREHIRTEVSALYDDRLRGHFVVGVHVRGTDGLADPVRADRIPFTRYFEEIAQRSAATDGRSRRVFLATDEENVVEVFRRLYGDDLVTRDQVRSAPGADPLGTGPTGQRVPGYIAGHRDRARRNGEDAVIDYAILGRSDVLVHNGSNLSAAARLTVPEAVVV